ncbi:MAG: SpaH/EbpB family LPXTG-anchored major pilin [Oscillospiraceae bacterium]|nr:SpaH/EbpB family LPXTG-anchored major pilin [Oscillospiraceae bacterium]
MKKRLLSIVMTLAMICALAVPAFATTTVTIGDSAAGTYSGYQLLKITGSTVDAASGETIYSYALNDTYITALTDVLETELNVLIESNDEIIAYLSDLESYGASTTLAVARALASALSGTSADATVTGGTATALDDGYWLFVSTSDSDNVILQTVCSDQGVTFDPKQNVPTVTKEVQEGEDWGNVADYEIGDDVYFRLTGTVSSYFDAYSTYYYQFEDTMSAGLSFNNDVTVTVSTTDSSGVTTDTVISEDATGATNYTVVYDSVANSFTVTFADLNELYDDLGDQVLVDASTVIVIEFTAELTEDAVLYDDANTNEVTLTYSNDPDDSSDYGTDDDDVLVYTYELQINKVDADDTTLGIQGAVFSLYRDAACTDAVIENMTSDADGYLSFQGLDAGTYYLKEITAPAGYNLLADAIEITITHTLNTAGDDYDTVTFTHSGGTVLEEGSTGVYNLLTVANNKGIELPSTGGMGTTIFTIVGIVVIAGAAGAYVVIRRRRA